MNSFENVSNPIHSSNGSRSPPTLNFFQPVLSSSPILLLLFPLLFVLPQFLLLSLGCCARIRLLVCSLVMLASRLLSLLLLSRYDSIVCVHECVVRLRNLLERVRGPLVHRLPFCVVQLILLVHRDDHLVKADQGSIQ